LDHSEKKRGEKETEKRLKEDDQMLLDSLEKESLGVKASERKNKEKKEKKEDIIRPKVGRPNSLKNKEFKSKETLPSDSDSDADSKPREKVKVCNSSDSEPENKSTTKKTLISSIFAIKNKKARELSDSESGEGAT